MNESKVLPFWMFWQVYLTLGPFVKCSHGLYLFLWSFDNSKVPYELQNVMFDFPMSLGTPLVYMHKKLGRL